MALPLEGLISSYEQMSSGERKIATVLDSYGIPFEYERPTLVDDHGKSRIWYPDFTLHPYGTLIEYFGVKNSSDYDRGIQKRLDTYRANQMDVIDMYPSSFSQGWEDRLLSRVDHILESRLYHWRENIQQRRVVPISHYRSQRQYTASRSNRYQNPKRYR